MTLEDFTSHLGEVVMDSTPSLFLSSSVPPLLETIGFSMPLTSILLEKPIYTHPFYTPYTSFLLLLDQVLNGGIDNFKRRLNRLLSIPPHVRILLLYSSKDALISHRAVEVYAEKMKGNGNQVKEKKWEDSPHVAHYKVHKKEYSDTLKNFFSQTSPSPLPPFQLRSKL